MGLLQDDSEDWFASAAAGELSAEKIDALLLERDAARANKNFARADEIRDQLAAAGVSIEDGAGGSRWRRSA
jgi:cysteinyl-tRNA synthetase